MTPKGDPLLPNPISVLTGHNACKLDHHGLHSQRLTNLAEQNLSLGIPNTFGWTCSTVNIYHADVHLLPLPPPPTFKPRLWRTQPEIEKSDHTYPPKLARGPSENDVDNVPFGRISLKSRFFRITSERDDKPKWTKNIKNAPWQALQNRKNRFRPNVMFH